MPGQYAVGLIGAVTIPNGGTNSNAMTAKEGYNVEVLLHGRSVTDGAITYKVQSSPDGGTTWYDLVDDAAAAVVPALQGKAKRIALLTDTWRIQASGAVSADRIWDVTGEL